MKNIILITGTESTRMFLHSQLEEYFNEFATIKSYAIYERAINEPIHGDLIVFSSKPIYDAINITLNNIPWIIANKTLNYCNIDKLLFLNKESKVLIVNDAQDSSYNLINHLKNLGIDHIQFIPYYPGIDKYEPCNIAVTPGEVDKVPSEVNTIIDLKCSLIDMSSLIEIMRGIGYYDEKVTDISSHYIRKIIEIGKKLAVRNNEVITLHRDLERVVLHLNSFQVETQKKFSYKIKNSTLLNTVGTDIKEEFVKKRYYAKYTFEHIIGTSEKITHVKNISKKLSRTNLSILIEGESGTGKELFAQAIHNYSFKNDGPFIAINFSALPKSLIESELFGYEPGAFTGAKKEGKIGLFEQAKGGTIFLDEIGDAPLDVQTRLLRVLQEKEIMKVGGDRIIPIDVRIIAATNKNLIKLIDEGNFREDLYYRLKMGYIILPPLKDRKEDISEIIDEFFIRKGSKLDVSSKVIEILNNRDWKGNVRELINTLEYSYEICDSCCIKEEHLPLDFIKYHNYNNKISNNELDDDLKIILKEIYYNQNKNVIVGRRFLSELLKGKGFNFSEQSVRSKLDKLQNLGLVTKSKGKSGTKISSKGVEWLKQNG